MSELRKRLAADAKRIETWAKQAEVTAAIVAHTVNPVAGPVAQQADLTSANARTEIQDLLREQQENWAEEELQRRKSEAGELQHVRKADPAQTGQAASREASRQARRSRQR